MTRRMYSPPSCLRQATFRRIRRATASIKKPIHNVKELRANPAYPDRSPKPVSLHLWSILAEPIPEGMVEPIGIEPMT